MNKQCAQCHKTFHIYPEDSDFYLKIDVPEPTLCPDCRARRRWTWRSELNLYQDKCDKCKKNIISMYAPGHIFPVYCYACWYGDSWTGKKYGQDINWNKSIIQQIGDLMNKVPVCGIVADSKNDNCDYNTNIYGSKNCYLCYLCYYSEDCTYSYYTMRGKNVVDSTRTYDCEYCYEDVQCQRCYNVKYSDHTKNCLDSYFLSHCYNCQNCIGCVNLKNKKYYIFNKQYSEVSYQKALLKFNFLSYQAVGNFRKKFSEYKKKFFSPAYHNENSENVIGEYLRNCSNCYYCFDLINTENCRYCSHVIQMKDCMDNATSYTELGYENMSGIPKYMAIATTLCNESSNVFYCKDVMYSKNCFASVGLLHEKNCILNKEYSEKDWEVLKNKIIIKMKADGEWGEFFPEKLSQFAYNESMAQVFYPLKKQDALNKGLKWLEESKKDFSVSEVVIPDNYYNTHDNIINKKLVCNNCGRNYKIIKQEFDFYQRMQIPLPPKCPKCRLAERFLLINPRNLWRRQCMCTQPDHNHRGQCNNEFETTYSPDRKELVYCEECYKREVY